MTTNASNTPKALPVQRKGHLYPLRDVDPEDILERYLGEESGADIAKSFGVTRAALSLHMLKHAEDQWKSAQLVKALTRKDQAEDLLENAQNALEVCKGRELLKSAQWDLERVCRRVYGQDSPQQNNAVQINVSLKRDSVDVNQESTDSPELSST